MNFVFGTIIAMLSFVTMTVLRARICCTWPDNARDFDAVADRDRSLRQNDEAADEIARDILQAKADPNADGAGKNGERAEMDAGVFQDNKNADDEDEIADDLRDGVLQRAIEPAVDEKAVEQKTLRPRRNPEDRDEQRDQQKNLDETERDSRQGRVPESGMPAALIALTVKKTSAATLSDRRDDRDEVWVELKAAEEPPDRARFAATLATIRPSSKERHEGEQPEERDVVPGHVKERAFSSK